MTEFRNFNNLPEFKLGVNNTGLRSNQAWIQRDTTKYRYGTPNKPVILPKQPEPNIFFTPIEDNREQMLQKMKKEMDDRLDFTRTYLPPRQ